MNKDIGFRRNIYRSWLDATAAFCAETDDPAEIRARLDTVVGQDIASDASRRMAIDILINIWVKTAEIAPALRDDAVARYQRTRVTDDRLWLHYGLTLLAYSFFRDVAATIGQLARYEDVVTPAMIKQRVIAERGQLGSLEKAVERVIFSLRDWNVLTESDQRYAYKPQHHTLATSDTDLETWLLACALYTHEAEALPFVDLLRLPELFPFRFSLHIDDLRRHPWFQVQRQGSGWDTVEVRVGRLVVRRTLGGYPD